MSKHASVQLNAVVLTALPVEFQAVKEHLTAIHEEIHPAGTVYSCGIFSTQEGNWNVAIVQVGPGNPGAAFEAERAIQHFRPHVVLFVGVAGGLKVKDVRLGDVVAATKVYGYESGKDGETLQPRPEVGLVTYAMEQRARAESSSDDWRRRIKNVLSDILPRALVGPIAAGEKVMKSRRSFLADFLQRIYEDALAIEMEGYGFLKATHANHKVDALIVRGISDLIEGKDEADKNNWQEIASYHASAFAFEVLTKCTRYEMTRLSQASDEDVRAQPAVQSAQERESSSYNVRFHGSVQNVALGENSKIINK